MNNQGYLIKVHGMTCISCAKSIDKALKIKGVDAQTNFISKTVFVQKNHDKKEVEKIIKSLGFKIKKQKLNTKKLFIISLIFTTPLFCHMFVGKESFLNIPEIQLILCLPVYIIGFFIFWNQCFSIYKK